MTALLPDMPATETLVVEMTNRVRVERKLAALIPNPELAKAARLYANYLAQSKEFSHTADGREAGERITAAGYQWCQIGENLASAQSSAGFSVDGLARQAVEGWLNSPGHRDNLLQPHVTEIGVGIARAPDKDPKYVTVQLFARPASMMVEFQVSNATKDKITFSFGGERHTVEPSFALKMSSCTPSPVAFETYGTGAKAKPLTTRFEVSDDEVYTVKPDAKSGARVEVSAREKVR